MQKIRGVLRITRADGCAVCAWPQHGDIFGAVGCWGNGGIPHNWETRADDEFLCVPDATILNLFFEILPPVHQDVGRALKVQRWWYRQNFGKKYNIIYYHTLCESNIPYCFLATIFKKLPIYYYAMLDKIWAVGTTFFVRKSASFMDFTRLNKLF